MSVCVNVQQCYVQAACLLAYDKRDETHFKIQPMQIVPSTFRKIEKLAKRTIKSIKIVFIF